MSHDLGQDASGFGCSPRKLSLEKCRLMLFSHHFATLSSGTEKHININKFAGLFWDWVGARFLLMCFFGVIPYGGE